MHGHPSLWKGAHSPAHSPGTPRAESRSAGLFCSPSLPLTSAGARVFLGWAGQQLPRGMMPCQLSLRAAARSAYELWQRC